MDILSYLSELIQTRKIVGIAGLGTVYKKKLPGRYDAATHSFVPPSYTLHFTTELKEDILLPAYISKQRNVSADTSNYFINEFSESLLLELDQNREAKFGNLGKLVKNGDQIHFEPAEEINYGFDFYGLPSIKANDQEEEQTPDLLEQDIAVEEIIPELQDVEEPVTEEPVPEEQTIEGTAGKEPTIEEQTIEEPVIEESFIEETEKSYTEEQEIKTQSIGIHSIEPPLIEEVEVEELDTPLESVLPEPEEVPTIASVVLDNEGMEENPGDEEKTNDHTDGISRKDEQQLRAEIEALNFYRSQSPVAQPSIPEQEEVISKLNEQTLAAPAAEIPATYTEDTYPIQPESKPISLFLKIILALSIIAMMMVVAYFVKPEWFNFLTGNAYAPIQQKVKPVKLSPADSTKNSIPLRDSIPSKDSAATPPVLKKDSAITSVVPAKQSADTAVVYEIIGASMHDQKEADGFIAQMKKSGITAKVVTNMSGRRLKMSIATLKDEESAQVEMKRLADKLKIKGMYIYKNKQN